MIYRVKTKEMVISNIDIFTLIIWSRFSIEHFYYIFVELKDQSTHIFQSKYSCMKSKSLIGRYSQISIFILLQSHHVTVIKTHLFVKIAIEVYKLELCWTTSCREKSKNRFSINPLKNIQIFLFLSYCFINFDSDVEIMCYCHNNDNEHIFLSQMVMVSVYVN